ncbi:BZ3500_MvSof-1268-A1-R1_Chr9g10481 [Microbotryum saponariae]|uniref:BZ3500_MvSof-1268-A1-R1_Chr9g10481 protein n=1 Tax=Microbotryum saponariae TaxID=289078 RepID=A0A2X0KA33_9BASI|nr:BZ3501_MvSof-1269-A2-R1_Chr9g10230 [Microbotryum saponariae]SDA00164.1 BZ3500_MvSof-1268-A1-R1_Chr9g10481 [Microbotryum saponariae]
MPNLKQALKLERVESSAQEGPFRFKAELSVVWTVGGKPHGGYLLALITSACSLVMKDSTTPDPAQLMTSFLMGCNNGAAEVVVTVVRRGKSWTNLEARIVQDGKTTVVSQALYTSFPSLPTSCPHPPFSTSNQYLLPLTPSPYAKRIPHLTHPSLCDPQAAHARKHDEFGRRWGKNENSAMFMIAEGEMEWVEDEQIKKRREEGDERGRKELEWASWVEFKDLDGEALNMDMMPFFSDIMSSIPELLPPGERVDPHYYPTLTMSIHFHTKLPFPSNSPYLFSPKTVGVYSTGHHIKAGRHEQLTEVWTAPSALGQGDVQQGWRERSMLLITGTQLAVSVDIQKIFGGNFGKM